MTGPDPFLALAALAAVLGLIWTIQRAIRSPRWARLAGAAAPSGRLRVVQAVALDQRRRLHLVRCDGRELLLLTGGGADVMLGWLEREAAP